MSLLPPAAIEAIFREIIAELYRNNTLEELTVKRVRIAAEQELSLEPGWFKTHEEWKDRSKIFITEECDRQANELEANGAAEPEPPEESDEEDIPIKPAVKKRQAKKRASEEVDEAPRKKIKSAEPKPQTSKPAVKKSGKKVIESSDDEDESLSREMEQGDTTGYLVANGDDTEKTTGHESESEMSELIDDDPPPKKRGAPRKKASPKAKAPPKNNGKAAKNVDGNKVEGIEKEVDNGNASESDMSSLIDEEPTKRKKKTASTETKGKKSKAKAKGTKDADLDPNELEIKKLKDWLSKCGIRKMWHKELAPYETPKKKISHLKEMLKNAGMDGRPSIAKANEIRERRELADELEEAQKFAQQWGKAKDRDQGRSAADAMADLGFELDDEDDD